MKGFMGFTKRNLLIYFKDTQSVLFSLMTSIIVLALYLLFLKGTFVDAMHSALEMAPQIAGLVTDEDISVFANLTLLVGILGSALITVPYNCLTPIISDRENRVYYDICATPLARWQIILSYFTAAALSSCIMTFGLLSAGLVILHLNGGLYLSALAIAKAYGLVVIGSVSATALFMIIVLFFKSTRASGAFFGMLSAAGGFIIGAYIPISQFSENIQSFCNLFPASHVTILLRNVLLSGILEKMDEGIGGIDNGLYTETIRELFTFRANFFGYSLEPAQMVLFVTGGIVVCIAGMILAYSKAYRA